tara:strand:+ start:6242 stop:6496 length:255 start_codon:yes stop_codon:yes gene_type:complete
MKHTDKPTVHYINEPRTLKQLQKLVGGYIEVYHMEDGRQLVINEEGKMMNLQHNQTATDLLPNNFYNDTVVGDAVVLSGEGLLD